MIAKKFKLVPLNRENEEFALHFNIKYALVGKASGDIHCLFSAYSDAQAKAIAGYYGSIMGKDAGYELMRLESHS